MWKKRSTLIGFPFVVFFTTILVTMQNNDETVNNPNLSKFLKQDLKEYADPAQKTQGLEEPMSQRKKRIKGVIKQEHPDLFAEYQAGIRTRHGESRPSYPPNYKIKELLKSRSLESTRALGKLTSSNPLNWVERGPGNISGRTRGMIVDPDDPTHDTWFAGSVSGGVWKTTNAGQSWTHLTAALPNLATSTLAMAASNHDVIYLGTGEGFYNFDQVDGNGVWKSTDRGITWEQLASTANQPEFQNIMRMIVDPTDENIILVATSPGFNHLTGRRPSSGIFRSTDGGTTWTKVYDSGSNRVQHLIAEPNNFNTQYATIRSRGVIKSVDGGLTWSDASTGIKDVRRMEIAIAPTDVSTLYISAEGNNDLGSVLFVSSDSGTTWLEARDISGNDIDWLDAQGWYDNTIAVSPYDKTQLFVGGVDLWQIDVHPGTIITEEQITGVDQENTASFFGFYDWNGRYGDGGLDTGENFHGLQTNTVEDDFTTVEIRFGPGRTQKGHRFTWASDFQYPYLDYVDVPFEVWDTDNNRQLMVSFRDQDFGGTWNPMDRTSAPGNLSREYIFVHAIPYDAGAPDVNIAQTAGIAYKNTYFLWPEAPAGTVFDPNTLPDATIRIHWGTNEFKQITTTNITDAYAQYGGTRKGVHVDHHNILLIPSDPLTQSFRLVNGNDGGVSYSDDGGETFTQPCNGYNTTQFYGVDKMNGGNRYVGGTQDNGSWVSPLDPDASSVWVDAPSGDGFQAVWHYDNPNQIIETSQFNTIFRSSDGGNNWTLVTTANGLMDVGSNDAPFYTKVAKSKQDPELIFAVGGSGVWRSDNFATNWTLIPMPEEFFGASFYTHIQISLANPQIVWAGRGMVNQERLYVSTNSGVTFSPTNIFTDVTLGSISGIATHPTDPNTAYALFSFADAPKILRTTDLGQTWEDISGFGTTAASTNGFPDVAVRCLLVMPYDTNVLWAGTEIGIFESTDGGGTWAFADNGLLAVDIWEMVIVNDQIVAATHGLGVWTVDLPELAGYEPPAATLSPRFNTIAGGGGGIINAEIRFPSPYDSSFVTIEGESILKFNANDTPFDTTVTFAYLTNGIDTVDVSLISYRDGSTFINVPVKMAVYSLLEAREEYVGQLNQGTNDFILSGFEITTPEGFQNGAIHSPHPYQNSSNLVAILRVPIVVAAEDALMKYDDIALIEPGVEGTEFGDNRFWDYVVVEGSADNGATWLPLADGYDARYNSTDWIPVYNTGDDGNSSLFVTHDINLLDTFSAGETILIRFRLFSDTSVNGWGWTIDNVNIQGETSVESDNLLPEIFSLSQNYPNPFNPSTTINYTLPRALRVTLKIYNIMGQKVWNLKHDKKQQAGFYSVTWDGRDLTGSLLPSGVYFYKMEAGEYIKIRKMTLLK